MDKIFSIFGPWQKILSDNAKNVQSSKLQEFLNKWKVKHEYSAVYHSQNNPVERVNRVINESLRCLINNDHRSWDSFLSTIQVAINSSVHESSHYSPYFLVFNKEMPLSGEDHELFHLNQQFNKAINDNSFPDQEQIFNQVRENLQKAFERYKKYYDLRARPKTFQIGDTVFKKNFTLSNKSKNFAAKLAPVKIPCKIVEKLGSNCYRLVNLQGKNLGIYNSKDLEL